MTSALVILQYNLFCRPSSFFWDRQRTRAQLIADNIYRLETHIRRSIDIITVCEAFDHQARNILCTKLLKQGFYYHTAILGDGQNMDYLEEDISSCFHLCRRCLVTNGGVMVFSRHPLEYHQQYLFHSDQIEGSDSLANKGAIYIRFQKNKQTFHLFATHLQAWNSKEAQNTRVAEFRFLQEKMKNIPLQSGDGLILSGDLNVNHFQNQFLRDINRCNDTDLWAWSHEYTLLRQKELFRYLDMAPRFTTQDKEDFKFSETLDIVDYTSSPFCWNGQKWVVDNQLVGRDGQKPPYRMEWIDYIMYAREFFDESTPLWTPDRKNSFTVACRLKTQNPFPLGTKWKCSSKNIYDLSDHYPVLSVLSYPEEAEK